MLTNETLVNIIYSSLIQIGGHDGGILIHSHELDADVQYITQLFTLQTNADQSQTTTNTRLKRH